MTALPAATLAGAATEQQSDDKLLPLVRRFQKAEAEFKAAWPMSDEDCDAWADANTELLMATFGVPALTAASALAALDVVIAERVDDVDPNDFEGCLDSLLLAARHYLAGKVT